MKERATWYISLDVNCPHCDDHIDLFADPEFCYSGIEVCEHGTERTTDCEAECPACGKQFTYDCIY